MSPKDVRNDFVETFRDSGPPYSKLSPWAKDFKLNKIFKFFTAENVKKVEDVLAERRVTIKFKGSLCTNYT